VRVLSACTLRTRSARLPPRLTSIKKAAPQAKKLANRRGKKAGEEKRDPSQLRSAPSPETK